MPGEWFHGWPRADENGAWWMRAAEDGGGYLLRFPGLLDARLSADGAHVRCQPLQGTPQATVCHLLLDQVLPLALGLAGELVLHAAAVAVGEEALAFVGPTGSGKSTLAAWFGAQGGSVLCDDCLVAKEKAGVFHAFPYDRGVRLWPANLAALFPAGAAVADVAHYSRKQRVLEPGRTSRARAVDAERPLTHLFFLQPAAGRSEAAAIAIEPLPAREAMMALVRATFLLEIRSAEVLAERFEDLGKLVDSVPCLALHYPRVHSALPEVHAAVIARFALDPDTGRDGLSVREPTTPPARGQ